MCWLVFCLFIFAFCFWIEGLDWIGGRGGLERGGYVGGWGIGWGDWGGGGRRW